MLAIDSHLDLAMNALDCDRDLTQSVFTIRQREAGMTDKGRAMGTVALPEMRHGRVFLSLPTVFARVKWPMPPEMGPSDLESGFSAPEIAYAAAQGQLAYYRVLESQGRVRFIGDLEALSAHVQEWQNPTDQSPLGFILSMEGADPIVSPAQLPKWWDDGLRVVSLSHYALSAYAYGTGTKGGLLPSGRELLGEMERLGVILDVSHLSEPSFWDALSIYHGPTLASHNCCRALVPGDRQLSDDQIRALVERDAVIGAAMDTWMLYPNWEKGATDPRTAGVGLSAYVDHIDHICQLAGNAKHAAIGTDLDGGYGKEQSPYDLETIADLQKIPGLLRARGYAEADVELIMYRNWLRFFEKAWS